MTVTSFIMELPEISQNVHVTYRRMRTMRLRIKPDGTVLLSVPWFTQKGYIRSFILSKQDWIAKVQKKFSTTMIQSAILPQDSAAGKAGFTSMKAQQEESPRRFEKRWREAAAANYSEAIRRFYPLVQAHTSLVPSLKLRNMKSLWGSCNRRNGIITLNTQLFRAPQACIDYVVLHELTHYLYQHHDAQFYGFIAQYMPDWKERQKYLNRTIGLS